MNSRNHERVIEEAIMDHPEQLGYPGALAVREFYFGHYRDKEEKEGGGRPDVLLLPILPTAGAHQLVIIEAKYVETDGKTVQQLRQHYEDARKKAVHELRQYYEDAQDRLGSHGLKHLRNFARKNPERARSTGHTKPKHIFDGFRGDEVLEKMKKGTKLKPDETGLFVALGGTTLPDSVERELVKACENERPNMGVVILEEGLEEGLPRVIWKIVVANRITETDRSTTP